MLDSIACIIVKILARIASFIPTTIAIWIGERFGLLGFWISPKRVRIGVQNLRAAYDGELDPWQARAIIRKRYKSLGSGAAEMFRLPVMDAAYIDRYMKIDGFEHLEKAVADKKRVMMLTGHYGNWEFSSIIPALKGYPLVGLARAQIKLPKLYELLISYRESKGSTIVHKGGAFRKLIRALDEGKVVAIIADQATRRGNYVDFFGRPALFARGPFELAYDKKATIIPAFIRRVHGAYHHVTVEPPFEFSPDAERSKEVQRGIEHFAGVLTKHIKQDPSQWLWMHKRWKHTTSRRALILSDGKPGHLKQSLAVVEAMKKKQPMLTHRIIEVRYRNRFTRGIALSWSRLMPGLFGAARCLQMTLTRESSEALIRRYADVIISCGSSTLPANVLWSHETCAKSVAIMNPSPLPVSRFDLVIAPRHDEVHPRSNVVQIDGAVAEFGEEELKKASIELQSHPNFRKDTIQFPVTDAPTKKTIALFIGGNTPDYEMSSAFCEHLIKQVLAAVDALNGWCLASTSRRTSSDVERMMTERLAKHPRSRLLLIANKDSINGTMAGMLGSADLVVVTGESISMVSEACVSGRHVVVVEPPLKAGNRTGLTKHQRFLQHLKKSGYINLHPVPEVAHVIQRIIKEHRTPKQLDVMEPIREAVAKLL